MRGINSFKRIFFIFFIFISQQIFSQLSKTHYIPPITESGINSSAPQDHYIYISSPKAASISFTIKPVGLGTGGYITGTVSNTTPYVYTIGSGRDTQLFVNANETSTVKPDKGYIIEAQDVIYVSIRVNAGSQAGALVSKGQAALGTTFRIGAYTNQAGRTINNNGTTNENLMSFISVMATEDFTTVNFSAISNNTEVENFSGTFPLDINLDKGESYVIAMNSYSAIYPTNNKDGLIGSLVTSDKPIVVNCGSANGSFHNGGGRDYGIDQIVDLSKVGTEYIFVKGDGENAWENVLIVAHTNNTTVSINGSVPVATINAGDYYVIEGDQYNNGNMYVQTSEPVFAYQGVGATDSEANQGMFFVPPLSCETRGNLDNITNIASIGSKAYIGGITIVTKVGATVTINNTPIGNFLPIGPNNVTGKTDYVTYKVTGLTGNISVQSTDELYCAYFNYNGDATSGSFYSGFPTAPEINFDTAFNTLGVCIPNVTLEVANMGNFDSIEWFFDDGSGSGFITTGNTFLQYRPSVSGTYKLIGKLDCSGLELESLEVPVSICPDDIDDDGIPDNIDIDNDNDGILNCTESNENQDIDLSNLSGGTIPIGGYTYTGTVTTIGNAATNPLLGSADGTFLSETPNKNNTPETSVTYDLIFDKSLNLLFEYATSTAVGDGLLTNDEEFIIRVPNTKTITLLDPNDQLLVDTNFDGVYETGITQISAFEIRFKLNSTSLAIGAGTFSFSANSVDAITYIHKNTSDTNSNQATFKLTATCVAKDMDLDGIEDALDLDSDNDGIPDFIENTGTLVTLSGIDTDSNGLDDIYDITAVPLDTDGDLVFDFYDLDSDNDGIYDIFESGSGLLDPDFNGVIDNVNATIGTNGWDDNAEAAPDSNTIGYTVNDIDSDAIFSYIDLDSDGDTCSDVIEAGFSDANEDGVLGDNIATTDNFGLVNNASDGYLTPNSDYLTAAPITITTQPINTEVCELSDTTISITSTPIDTIQWELNTDGINWTTIVDDATYSGSQTNELTIIATPLTFDTHKYRAFLNVAGNSCGLYTDEIALTVIVLPVANTAPTMLLCDDDNNGTMPFDLTLQNSPINTTSGMTITYHASQADADIGNAPLVSPYESSSTTVYARVVNDLNTSCYDTSSFDLEVYESPFPLDATDVTPIQECDNTAIGSDTDGFIIFDLTQRETEILNGQSASDFILTYFSDSGYTNQIANPTAYPNTTAYNQTIYVRVANSLYGTCFVNTALEIEVYELPQVSNPNTYRQCDDASNDGQAFFNLELDNIKEEINPNYIAEGLTFTFYEDQTTAETNGMAIPNPSNYQDAIGPAPETIWVRVENPNSCFRIVPLTLEVSPSSSALSSYSPNSIYQCDDGSNARDGVATFDLTTFQNYISTTFFLTFKVTIHFYESQIDAELETNEILDPANHQNTNSPNSQDIWVRVKSDSGNNCLGLEEFPDLLIVEALPTANPVVIERQCDFDTTDAVLSYPFDTSQLESNILNGQNAADVTITYFDASGSPLLYSDGTSVISPIQPVFLTESQTITIRVTNNTTSDPDGACYDETSIEFTVDQQPVAYPVPNQIFCDDGTDGTSENDGLHRFDTSTFQNTILSGQTGMDVFYNYQDENGTIVSNATSLPNPLISGSQTITVYVINLLNSVCSASTSINLIVNPLPAFSIETPQIVCSSDPTFTIVLDPIEANASEPFDYEWKYQDGSVLSSDPTLIVSTPGTYFITLTKTDGTGCSKTLEVFVNSSELATITMNDIVINDISDNNTITINTTNLGLGDYEYALDNEFSFYQDEPFFNDVKAGIHILYIRDKNGCGTSSIEISIIGYPKFFTPNGDGIHDYWNILGVNTQFQPKSAIYIFDRYGKLLKQLDARSNGWDGSFNGAFLPNDDYWFRVLLQDGREFKGHFSLKR